MIPPIKAHHHHRRHRTEYIIDETSMRLREVSLPSWRIRSTFFLWFSISPGSLQFSSLLSLFNTYFNYIRFQCTLNLIRNSTIHIFYNIITLVHATFPNKRFFLQRLPTRLPHESLWKYYRCCNICFRFSKQLWQLTTIFNIDPPHIPPSSSCSIGALSLPLASLLPHLPFLFVLNPIVCLQNLIPHQEV